jgi:hypothetical protein
MLRRFILCFGYHSKYKSGSHDEGEAGCSFGYSSAETSANLDVSADTEHGILEDE